MLYTTQKEIELDEVLEVNFVKVRVELNYHEDTSHDWTTPPCDDWEIVKTEIIEAVYGETWEPIEHTDELKADIGRKLEKCDLFHDYREWQASGKAAPKGAANPTPQKLQHNSAVCQVKNKNIIKKVFS